METFFCHACCAETGALATGSMCYMKRCSRCGKTAYCIRLPGRPPAATPATAPPMDEATAELRDRFAMMAMNALLMLAEDDDYSPDAVARNAYFVADAMLRARGAS